MTIVLGAWQPIETAPLATRILLWCADTHRGEPVGIKFGRIVDYGNGDRVAHGEGMSGDWTFTHWMPLPEPPEA